MSDSDSEYEIMQPPERREASSRSSKGNRMSKLLAEEVDNEEGDADFYNQGFWAEDEEDHDFAAEEADDEDGGVDSFDSDFGDSTDTESDEEEDDKPARKEKPAKRSVYRDPKLAHKKGEAPAAGSAPKPKAAPRKRKSELAGLGDGGPSRGSMRGSTQASSKQMEEKRKRAEALAKQRAERLAQMGGNRGVEMRRLTQEEILEEAKETEAANTESLALMLHQEEEKRKVVVRDRDLSGPRVKYTSRREGDSVRSFVTFANTPIPKVINAIAPAPPAPQRCTVTQAPAKYLDPQTGCAYATLEAYRLLRGSSRRRHSSFGTAGGAAGGGDE